MHDDTNDELDQMWTDDLLCEVCQERPLTQHARFHDCMVCDACAEGEPDPDDAEAELMHQEMCDQEDYLAELAADAAQAEAQEGIPPTICDHDLL